MSQFAGGGKGNESGYLKSFGDPYFCNFLYQGQYHDRDIGDGSLVYNRFRYYDIDIGTYISQDPIGLEGGMPNMYAYVEDVNLWIDPFGLSNYTPKVVRRFMSKSEFKQFKKNGFKYNPNDPRGGISTTSVNMKPKNPDKIKGKTGALGADYYADIKTDGKNVELKGNTKNGWPDYKIKSDIDFDTDVVETGRVCK